MSWVRDIGEEMCKPDDSWTCTPGANNIFYVNRNHFKKLIKIKDFAITDRQSEITESMYVFVNMFLLYIKTVLLGE